MTPLPTPPATSNTASQITPQGTSQDTPQDAPPAQALGLSGHLTRLFIDSPLTPLLLLAGLAFGLLALSALPREEEPQISVPMVDVQVRADGLAAADAIELLTKPLEEILKAIAGVEHIYSQTADDGAIVTARFVVGTTADEAILRVHEKIRANFDRIPHGIPEPLIVGRGIDDVAILTLTLSPRPEAIARWDDTALHAVADTLLAELVKVPDVGLAYLVGGRPEQIRIEPDPERLALLGITLNQVVEKLRHANRSFVVGNLRHEGGSRPVVAGQTLQGVADIGLLLLTTRDGRPVYLKDVATVVVGGAPLEHRVWHLVPAPAPAPDKGTGTLTRAPAVTLALAKRAGANAVVIADAVLTRLHALEAQALPVDLMLTVTRNYGETAAEKADELLFHLTLATLSIVALVAVAIGWREGLVVLVVIPTTILLTLFASWLLGYTINRVSLFALIFSIGILVDDAIVLVENIHRHWTLGGAAMVDRGARRRAAIAAVAEVGNPTVIATLTVIVALLPMMFVSGLMGPYMSPIPANASAAMLFSFFVAVMLVPWLMVRLRGAGGADGAGGHGGHCASGGGDGGGWLGHAYLRVARPLLAGRRRAWAFLLLVGLATLASTGAFYSHDVTVKLLPFDNKSELQVTVDLPAGAALEDTERVLFAAADRLADLPELSHLQLYAGTPAPFNFNGLVRHGYLRHAPELGELQLTLTPRHARTRPSHDIALDVRRRLAGVAAAAGVRRSGAGDGVGGPAGADVGAGASDVGIDVGAVGAVGSDDTTIRVGAAGSDDTIIRVNEVPPGPPVLATLLAEVYGPDAATRTAAAERVAAAFRAVDFIVDIDRTARPPGERLRFALDRERLESFGVEEQAVYDTLQALVGGVAIGYSHRGDGRDPVEIAVRLPKAGLFASERLLATPVPTRADIGTGSTGGLGGMGSTGTGTGGSGGSAAAVVELGDLVTIRREPASVPRFRRDGRDAEMVMGELAGRYEAPIYGLLAVNERLAGLEREDGDGAHEGQSPLPAPIQVRLHGQPEDESVPTLLWDGEWEITWVTFRDMGAAFAVALLGIYLLVVAQFRSFKLPLVVLLPVPLTLIGIVGGHWLFNASFTAASMIGFIALAGIIVRNSILLIDFIRHRRDGRTPLRDVVLEAGAIRFRPILLTALAAMIGAAFILTDPIFQGLAISLLFGLLSSTLLTVLVIPAVYLVLRRR